MGRVKSIAISEARPKLTQLVEEVGNGDESYFIIANSKLKAVLMGIDEYNSIQERLEDLEDSLDILKSDLAGEPDIPIEEYLKERGSRQKSRVPASH